MKYLIKTNANLVDEGRWDIDYHLPAEKIREFPSELVVSVSEVAELSKKTRDPGRKPEEKFSYVDIASIDVNTGKITNPQELIGEEAPSRARKVIQAFDVIISTVRPTRGAIAVIPPFLHNQICSTGFCVLKCKPSVNPFYLHFLLRSDATSEQFRKFSTGSSYPAILDEDVLKTHIPYDALRQDTITQLLVASQLKYEKLINQAKAQNDEVFGDILNLLKGNNLSVNSLSLLTTEETHGYSVKEITEIRKKIERETLPLFDQDDSSEQS